MSKAKKPEVVETVAVVAKKKIVDTSTSLQKLALKLGFARNKRLAG